MSSETKDNLESPEGSSKVNSRAKSVLTSASHRTTAANMSGFGLGQGMSGSLKDEDIQRIISIQKKSLKNFARTNELLGKFNDFSSSKYDALQHMFLQHTRLLVDLKKDLTNVFLRIRRLKETLQKQYPEAFDATFNLRKDLEDRLELEEASKPTYVDNTTDEHAKKKERKNDKVMIDINNELSLESKHKKEISETENSGLHSDFEKINIDSSSETNFESRNGEGTSCMRDETESLEDLKNGVKNYKESEETEDESTCGNNDSCENEILRNENAPEDIYSNNLGSKKERDEDGHEGTQANDIVVIEGIKECELIKSNTDSQCDNEMNDKTVLENNSSGY